MTAVTSAATEESHMPFTPNIKGSSMTAADWKTSVRKKEIRAEVKPSPKAVKKDEPNMAKPEKRNENENILKPCNVRLNTVSSYPTKIFASGSPRSHAAPSMAAALMPMITKLFRRIPESSFGCFAPKWKLTIGAVPTE